MDETRYLRIDKVISIKMLRQARESVAADILCTVGLPRLGLRPKVGHGRSPFIKGGQAGFQFESAWIPACAGMTKRYHAK